VTGAAPGRGLVVETVVSTLGETGAPHFAAMGVVWGDERIVIRPYTTTRTFRHLRQYTDAVVNVTDDVLLFAKSALTHERLDHRPASRVRGVVLEGACHWREVTVERIVLAPDAPRADVLTRVVTGGAERPFVGLCRAKHAVVEASILASRLRLRPLLEILDALAPLGVLVDKTGGPREREAFAFIEAYIAARAPRAGSAR
jgi:uncharacterized protein